MFQAVQRQAEHLLFDVPDQPGLKPLRWLAVPLRYIYALLRDLARGELGLRAMSLVYTTLFATVPIVAVSVAVLKVFGIHREIETALLEFVRPLGARGTELITQIMAFVDNVQGALLGTVGFAFLLYTVVTMIQKVEEALNFTWHVQRPRSLARRATEYLVVMVVGPVIAVTAMVLLASIEASEVVDRLSGLAGGSESAGNQVRFAPYLLIIGLFTFVYVYMPNTRVRLGPALVGATFAGVLWAAVGALFARIVVYSTKTLVIYAGFAVVLLSLVWLHLSWLILLLGAQLSFYVQHPEYLRTGHSEIPMTGALRERLAMSVMYLVGRSFLEGGPRWSINALAERLEVPGTVIDEIVTALEQHGLVLTAEDDTVAPARALDSIRLDQVLDAIRNETHDPRRPVPQPVPTADAASSAAESAMMDSMKGRSLRDLVGP